jgi:hypothetical protein
LPGQKPPALEAIKAFLGAPLKELDEASFSGMLFEV